MKNQISHTIDMVSNKVYNNELSFMSGNPLNECRDNRIYHTIKGYIY